MGLMGSPIALKLCGTTHDMVVWGRSPKKLAPAVEAGASIAISPAALATQCDVMILCVTDTSAVESVVFGPEGLAAGGSAGKVVVDHSSISPDATIDIAARLKAQAGMEWVDAPVSGGAPGVANKTLVVMAGASQSVFDDVYPIVMNYAGRMTRMGPVGAGQSTKLINQALVGAGFAVLAEATRLAMDAGIDANKIPAALAGGRADSSLLQEYMPHMANGDFSPRGRIDIVLKDLLMVADLATATGTPTPMLSLATQLHRLMVASGHGADDNAAIIKLLEQQQQAASS